jgi:hypothetical protein
MEISDRIAAANSRLKSSGVNIAIEQEGLKLRLRATLPPRQGDGAHKQQRIPVDISASVEGIRQAESEAHAVQRDLDTKCFNWVKYIKTKERSPKIISEWLFSFEVDYFEKRDRNAQSLTTWKTDYCQAFKNLPLTQPLTPEVVRQTILATKPDSKTRKRYCVCLGALSRFAGLNIDVRSLAGKYSPKMVAPRNIPDDGDIASWYYKFTNPAWAWVYGILATYGLRNHEVFRIDFDILRAGGRILHVLGGKTGARRVWACYPEWFDEFNLSSVLLPGVNLDRTNPALGNNVTHYFSRKVPFAPYNLRHAWAIRTLEFGLDISLAAQQMGHSLKVHSELYHHWISDKHHQRAYDLLMQRSDRPKSPAVNLTKS